MKLPIWLLCATLLCACGDDDRGPTPAPDGGADMTPPCDPSAYPQGPFGVQAGQVLDPNLAFTNLQAQATTARDLADRCGAAPRALVLRVQAGWCGPCRWQAAHAREISDLPGVRLLDVLARDEENLPTSDKGLARFAARHETPSALLRGSGDLLDTLQFAAAAPELLPLVLVIDTATMKIQQRLSDPDPDQLRALLGGAATPTLYDGRFRRDRWDLIQQMALPADAPPPPDPTNRYADDPNAAALGRTIFNDTIIGGRGLMSCAFCHRPISAFQDGKATSPGLTPAGATVQGDRNTPWLGSAPYQRAFLWDGRADSLWSQALGPLENDKEFSSSRLRVARWVVERYFAPYRLAFGEPPDLSDTARFPAEGRPGTATWDAMRPEDRAVINRIYANSGKAVAAFERGIRLLPGALDRYAAGDRNALSSDERDGLLRFFELGCAGCHYGPLLYNEAYHNLRFTSGRGDGMADRGRAGGLPELLQSDFRGDGAFSDDPASAAGLKDLQVLPAMEGQIRTPSLRGVADTAPYGHGGAYDTLERVLEALANGGEREGSPRATGALEAARSRFDAADGKNSALLQFLRTLKADIRQP